MLKRIPIDDHPDLVKIIKDTYTGAQVHSVYVHKITIDEGDVTIEIDLEIDGTWGITGSFQIGLDDDNSLAEKLREIIHNNTTRIEGGSIPNGKEGSNN